MHTSSRTMFSVLLISSFLMLGNSRCQKDSMNTDPGDVPDTTSMVTGKKISYFITTGDQTSLFESQPTVQFQQTENGYPDISVDTTQVFQTVDGFGFTLTDGSALLIDGLPERLQTELLQDLFGRENGGIGISYLRVSIGASDLSDTVYTYNDLPPGET